VSTLDLCFDDARLSLAQRVRRWQDAVGDHLVEVDMRPPAEAPRDEAFTGSMRLRPLGEDTIALVDASYQSLARTPERIRRAERETALLTLVVSGECRIAQEGRSALLKAGDLCVYESVRPYRIDVAARVKALVVATDHTRLEALLGDLRLYTATPLSSAFPAGSLAARYWRDLAERLPMLDNTAAVRLAYAGLDIVAAGLGTTRGLRVGGVNSALTLQRAKDAIATNFHRPALSVARVAALVGVSPRRLQELFQRNGMTMSDYIRTTRLDAARRRLVDPAFACISVAQIAENVGFADPAYFSRAFRRAFGVSPRAARGGGTL
jgi:AraC-like DNA-binding protein